MNRQQPRQLGIVSIEKKIQAQHEQTDRNISSGFQDLRNLINLCQDMVGISKNIKEKLKEKGTEISSDEAVLFKSYLLSLGVNEDFDEDPVKRSKYNSDNKYYNDLGKQIHKLIKPLAKDRGGQIALPERKQNLGLKMVKYSSGLVVLQCDDFDQNTINNQILDLFNEVESTSAQELAVKIGVSVALARQRLLDSENFGLICRDASVQGLRFYPNKFLE
ncbi:Vacuolar protein-sorting-associated protein 36 [Tyrophagus putrescentiae]|nr:Vacuolar protein-sorting-associated protein 36 [Tyrophagus putrescentiae]